MKAEEVQEFFRLRDRLHAGWLDPVTGQASRTLVEATVCPLCGGGTARPGFAKKGFFYVRCANCGLWYVNPRLRAEELVRAHQAQAWQYFYDRFDDVAGVGKWGEELAKIAGYRRPGRLLDIASGDGSFLGEAKAGGWEVRGVEVNSRAAALARERHGVAVEEGTVESVPYQDHSYDVVTIFHALDQFHDPRAVLREVRRILVPGGLLVTTVPNIQSFIVWMLGSRHRHFTPEKGCYFSPRTLTRMVREAGFQVLSLRTFGEECTMSTLVRLARTGCSFDLFEERILASGFNSRAISGADSGSRLWRMVRSLVRAVDGRMIQMTRRLGLGAYVTLYAESTASST